MVFPDWESFTPDFAKAELKRLLASGAKAVEELEQSELDSFESVSYALNDALRELWRTWGKLSHLSSVMNSDQWRQAEEEFQPAMVQFSLRVGQSRVFYRAMKNLLETPGKVADPVRRRILEKAVRAAELSGVALKGSKLERFNAIQAELARLAMEFSNSVIDATKAFKYEKDGKAYTIDDAAYPETMKHCPDREVREVLFRARSSRAPDNAPRIAEILRLRREMSSILGYADYARLSLSSKCAPSVEAVMKMIDELDGATLEISKRELEELSEGEVAPWDRAYLSERLREERYSYSEEELKQYFELSDVLNALWRISGFLFDIEVKELTGDKKPSVWHPDVRFFAVEKGGREVAYFYLDPFVRNGLKRGGAWMNEFGNRSDRLGEKPLAVLVLNLPEPDGDGRCLLPMREVETLFHEFGHALQCMLTEVAEEDAAGINLVEWDAVEVASQFMENWCIDARTGIRLPEELKKKVVAAKKFMGATACRRQLAFSKVDLMLHSSEVDDPELMKREVFTHFGVPMVEEDRFLCSFSHIFAGGYAAGYYSYKWSEVMSLDAYGAFEEAGLDDDAAIKSIGRRYRDTVLALGGSIDAMEVFRRFRGRDPEISAMLRQFC